MDETFNSKYLQLKAFARVDGLIIGIMMIATFLFMIGGFKFPLLGLLSQLMFFAIAIVVWLFCRRFRDNVLEGFISFRRAFAYSFSTMINGGLVSSFFMFIYFQWIDKGYFINQYLTVLESKDGRNLMTAFGVSQSQFDEILTLASSMTALDIAVQFFVSNAFIAIFLSLVIAVTIKKQNAVN